MIADPLASLIGLTLPYLEIHNKRHLTGTFGGAFVYYLAISFLFCESLALIASFAFILYEVLFPNYEVLNDNLVLPLWVSLWIFVFSIL